MSGQLGETSPADIDALQRLNAELRACVDHDALTGAWSRPFFENRVRELIAEDVPFAVMMIDVDNFKTVNDTLGHSAGDDLLRRIAAHIMQSLEHPGDGLARIGGDEFAVILKNCSSPDEAWRRAEPIHRSASMQWTIDGCVVQNTCSCGVALTSQDAGPDSLDALMRSADLALYKAKSAGRDRCIVFTRKLNDEAERRRLVTRELQTALSYGDIGAALQGLFRMRGRSLSGFEALARWNHPRRGTVLPGEFISVARDARLLNEVTSAVLGASLCELGPALRSGLTLSVNIAPVQLRSADLPQRLLDHLELFDVSPTQIIVEITEVGLDSQEALRSALSTMHDLVSMGCRLIIDDFGLGAASLSYLRDYPVHGVKVSGDFTSTLGDPFSHAISASVAALGEQLGLHVIAERVETSMQFNMLDRLGFSMIQGHLLHRPDTPAAAAALAQQELVVI